MQALAPSDSAWLLIENAGNIFTIDLILLLHLRYFRKSLTVYQVEMFCARWFSM